MDGTRFAQSALAAALARPHQVWLFHVGVCEVEGTRDAAGEHSGVEGSEPPSQRSPPRCARKQRLRTATTSKSDQTNGDQVEVHK